jgi:hypothetical protein
MQPMTAWITLIAVAALTSCSSRLFMQDVTSMKRANAKA